jgi:hypothetical protein
MRQEFGQESGQEPAPRKPRRWLGRLGAGLAVIAALIIGIAIGSAHSAPKTTTGAGAGVARTSAPATPATPASPTQAAPAATPSPNGTFQGACSYTLGSDPANGTAVATGDINVTNTGNIGTVTRLTITWPQEGFAPLSMTKTVRVPAGKSDDVQFNRPMTSTEVDNLQNYQSGHSDDGCTYHGDITATFGSVQGG